MIGNNAVGHGLTFRADAGEPYRVQRSAAT